MRKRVRCAIYTRKSTEDGLEQEFNSLDAQREACAAFIKSQKGLGWKALTTRYDDGGLSGGTLERPALKALLADIDAGKIDLVVVYKVDRLTRSLTDFAKIVELFDTRGVSFVSVTQQFNTSTSMGRLTLNVLLSFAQFEREVTGERIRDKIAASKKKGMWMGGQAPLGYEARDKKLVIVQKEADTVEMLYRLYLELGSVRAVVTEATKLGLSTKVRTKADGSKTGGRPFSRGHLYQLLSNPLYVGCVIHKSVRYPGLHEAIIDKQTFEAVQQLLTKNASARVSCSNTSDHHLLTGFVFDDTGDRLCPTHTNKKGQRYRYHISKRVMNGTSRKGEGWRLPAPELEGAVIGSIADFIRNKSQLIDTLSLECIGSDKLQSTIDNANELAAKLKCRATLENLCQRIEVTANTLTIEISRRAFVTALCPPPIEDDDEHNTPLTIAAPVKLRRRGAETKIVISTSVNTSSPDPDLISIVARARIWWEQLCKGDVATINEIASREEIDASDVTRCLPLAFLAPDIVEAILNGDQPVDLTAECLKRIGQLPADWAEQRHLLGFTA